MEDGVGISFGQLSLNRNFDGGEAHKFLLCQSCCTTPLNPIPSLTTELLLGNNPYPAGLSEWAFTESHQMNFTKVRKTAFTTELRWAQGQPFAYVVSLRHVACSGISSFNSWVSESWGPARGTGRVPTLALGARPSVSTGNRDVCVPPKMVAETSVALTKNAL